MEDGSGSGKQNTNRGETTKDRNVTTVTLLEKRKPFLGGYRNKVTGVEYHNASSQTYLPPSKYKSTERNCRDSQTAEMKTQCQQTDKDAWTQVERTGIYLPCHEDKAMAASNSYVSAVEIIANEISAALLIQKCCRRWLAKRELRRLQAEQERRRRWEEEQERLRKYEEEEWLQQQLDHRAHPRTKSDFKLLFSDLKKWWQAEVAAAKQTKSGAQLKATLCDITDQEVEYIKNIDSKKKEASEMNMEENRFFFLNKATYPKMWKTQRREIMVETPGTVRAHTLRNLYYTLSMENLSTEERINALLTLKEIIKEHDCTITKELTSLSNREIELLLRGVKENCLVGLKRRIRTLFWQYTRQPAFNPEALRLLKAEESPDVLSRCTFACIGCGQYCIMPPFERDTNISSNVYTNRLAKCDDCRYVENEGCQRKENEAYRRMLKFLKEKEIEEGCTSGLVFLLQISDICYIVEKIWNRESALSGSDVLKDLELARWDRNMEWSPWNCMLLTRQEALVHSFLENPDQVYNIEFVQAVHLKHVAARTYFSSIPRMLPYLTPNEENS